jgi:hypothetical protein
LAEFDSLEDLLNQGINGVIFSLQNATVVQIAKETKTESEAPN